MKEHNLISGDFGVLFDRSCFANETDTISFVSLCLFSFSPMYKTAYLVCKVRTIVTSFPITLEVLKNNATEFNLLKEFPVEIWPENNAVSRVR